MQGNGIISVKSISKIFRKLFAFLFRKLFSFLFRKRSTESLITHRKERFDTKGEMRRMELGRDNMEEFVKIVPDECIVDLSHRWYCNG